MMAGVADILRKLIRDQLDEWLPDREIGDNATLDDLGMDSLDLVELVMAIEEEYTIALEDDEVDGLHNFSDMVKLVEGKLGHETEDHMARTRREGFVVQSDIHFADLPPAIRRAEAEGAAEVMGTTPEVAADILAASANAASITAAARVITAEMLAASDVAIEITAASPPRGRKRARATPTDFRIMAEPASDAEAVAVERVITASTPTRRNPAAAATIDARLQINARRRQKAAEQRAAAELRAASPLSVDSTGFPAAILTPRPSRRRKMVEGGIIVEEAAASVEAAPAEETPAQKQSRALAFDPFTLNGTEENPIFLVDSESVRGVGVVRYDRVDGWRRRLAICRGEFDGRTVYSFTKEKLLLLAASLKKIVTTRHGTSHRHVELVRIGTRTRIPPELTQIIHQPVFPEYPIEDFAGRGSAYSAIAAAILGPVLQRKIIFVNEMGFSERGGYQIYIANNIPGGRRVGRHLRNIYGIEDHNDYPQPVAIYDSEQSNSRGSVVFIQDQNINIAELHPNGLLILAQLRDDFYGIRVFHRILVECLQYLSDPESYERARAEMARLFRESQQKYIIDSATRALEWVERNFNDGSERSAGGMRSVARRDHIQQQIRDMERQLGELNLRLFAVETTNQQATMDRIRREFNFLADGRFALINKIYFDPDGDLHIITDPIVAYDRQTRKYHLLGPCEIIAEFPGKRNSRHYYSSSGGVRLTQYVQPGQRLLALPHCGSEGTVCWGNIGHEIASLLAGFELQALAALVITFLQRPNPFDRDGRRVRNFPETASPTGHDPTPVREADRNHASALGL